MKTELEKKTNELVEDIESLYTLTDQVGIKLTTCIELIKPLNLTEVEVNLIVAKNIINQMKSKMK